MVLIVRYGDSIDDIILFALKPFPCYEKYFIRPKLSVLL